MNNNLPVAQLYESLWLDSEKFIKLLTLVRDLFGHLDDGHDGHDGH